MSELDKEFKPLLNECCNLRKNHYRSKIVDKHILSLIESFIWANTFQNFYSNLNQENIREYNLPKGKINLIKKDLNKFYLKAKNVISAKEAFFKDKDYYDFRKLIINKYPPFRVLILEIEKEIQPKKTINYMSKQYMKTKVASESKELQPYFTTIALEMFIKKKKRLPYTKKDFGIFSKLMSKDDFQKFSELTFQNMEKRIPSLIKSLKSDRAGFDKRLLKTWGKPLNYFQALLHTSYEAAYYFREKFPSKINDNNKYIAEALLRIHARALKISNEILTLLSNGYPDGANSRWRSLYELAVISFFISQNSTDVAQRYLEHEAIDRLNRAESYMKHHKKLKYPPIRRDRNKLRNMQQRLCAKYGDYYKNDYGWIPRSLWGSRTGVGFGFIEESVNLSHLNPFYKLSCSHVHGGSGGFYSLGLINQDELLLIGSSNYGLADPVQNSAISIHQITVNLLNIFPDFEGVISMGVMQLFVDRISASAINVQKGIKERDAKFRRSNQ